MNIYVVDIKKIYVSWGKEPVDLAETPIDCVTPTLCEKSEQKRNTMVANTFNMHLRGLRQFYAGAHCIWF